MVFAITVPLLAQLPAVVATCSTPASTMVVAGAGVVTHVPWRPSLGITSGFMSSKLEMIGLVPGATTHPPLDAPPAPEPPAPVPPPAPLVVDAPDVTVEPEDPADPVEPELVVPAVVLPPVVTPVGPPVAAPVVTPAPVAPVVPAV